LRSGADSREHIQTALAGRFPAQDIDEALKDLLTLEVVSDGSPLTGDVFTGGVSKTALNTVVLNRLTKYDIASQKLLASQGLDHTYYVLAFNHAGDKLYLAGTFNDIGIHDPETLNKIGSITLPGGDMSTTTRQIFIR